MSSKLLAVFFLLLAASAVPAQAADSPASDSPQQEIIYRASLGNADDIRILLKQGASPNQKNDQGVPLLCLAAARIDKNAVDVAKALLQGGADLNGTDDNGQTALFYAARIGNLQMVNFLLATGIHYYAQDKEGNIARTIAFQSGHPDIVKAMDDFVRDQTKKVEEDYKKANDLLARRYKEQQEEMLKLKEKEAALATPKPAPPPPVDKAAEARKQENTLPLEKGLSYHACEFQYWYFVDAAKEPVDLTPEQIEASIDAHRKQVEAIAKTLIDDYGKKSGEVANIMTSAKKRIFNQLTRVASGGDLHEKGVGTMSDADARCQAVSHDWDIDPASIPTIEPPQENTGNPATMAPLITPQMPYHPPPRQRMVFKPVR